MNSFRYFMPALVAVVYAMPASAQKSTCDLVTQSEAAAIIGSDVEKRPFASTCLYKSKTLTVSTSTLSLHLRVAKKDSAAITAAKDRVKKIGGTVKNEPSLGKGAFSTVAPNSNRIFVFKGDKMLTIDYRDSTPAKIPSGPMDKLRQAAKTALDRL